jgi:hypothetical protein
MMDLMAENNPEPETIGANRVIPNQDRVFELLVDTGPEWGPRAAQAYRGSIKVLEDKANPDRFTQSSHSAREVLAILSRDIPIPLPEDNPENALTNLIKTFNYRQENLFKLVADSTPELKAKVDSLGPVERDSLLKKLAAGRDPKSGPPDQARTPYEELGKLSGWFTGVCHHGEENPSEKDQWENLIKLSGLLEVILSPHEVVIESIDKLLALENPNEQDLESLLKLMTDYECYRYFFDKAGKQWLSMLREATKDGKKRFFAWPPDPERGGYWPESQYLARIAKESPNEVMEIIKERQLGLTSKAPWIRGDFVDAALKMPARVASQLVNQVIRGRWAELPYHSMLPEKLGKLMAKLAQEGEQSAALALAQALLDVTTDGEREIESGGSVIKLHPESRPLFDPWEYKEILEKDVPSLLLIEPEKTTLILFLKLKEAIDSESMAKDREEHDDFSYIWYRDIASSEGHNQLKPILVSHLRDALVELGKKDISKLKELLSSIEGESGYSIFKRLKLHLYRQFPESFNEEIQGAVEEFFDDRRVKVEYDYLIEEQFSELPPKLQEWYMSKVAKGPEK